MGGPADAFFFTDGYSPDPRKQEKGPPRIGGVYFARWRERPVSFSVEVTPSVISRWFPRLNQINQIEMLAVAVLFEHFGAELAGKRVIGCVDSNSGLGAIVKGYSNREDISDLCTEVWSRIARHQCIVYFDRVSTDANIGDGPSRDKWKDHEKCKWQFEHLRIPTDLGGIV